VPGLLAVLALVMGTVKVDRPAARPPAPRPSAVARITVPRPVARPPVVPRSKWLDTASAREQPPPRYDDRVVAVFIHHTDSPNGYDCADTPRIIRDVYTGQTGAKDWDDIGYNFLVDRCGTIYEGRAGGVAEPVLGAHTLGFNTNSAGVAALGTYVTDEAPEAQIDGISQIAAWKLGLTGKDAQGTATLVSASDGSKYKKGTSVKFNAISGHRDAFNTECPGEELYARLGDIRASAATLQGR
jgi:uncharacterized protein with LGFP repeats